MKTVYELLTVIINATSNQFTGEEKIVLIIGIIFIFILLSIVYCFFIYIVYKICKMIFRKIKAKHGNSITIQFVEKAITVLIIAFFIVVPMGGDKLAQSLLGSTAVIAAIVGLAANDVIKNMFAGLEISIYKPFDIGNRIVLEDGQSGIVEKMNLRHVVIQQLDTTRLIIPNSRLNGVTITNFSYEEDVPRSIQLHYSVSYDTDLEKAKEVIRKTICENPLTLNKDGYNPDNPNSKSVYFLELTDSSIVLGATIYYPQGIRTEVVKDEVNTAVFNALKDNGIEIPYNYVNVVMSGNV
ncbi:mechanosensitive ion channel family protein [Butyrivibrio sp. AE3004]|uniref:mechanosensitive ion channel family protein n=1 Tax=Butyrivibrio sp. AE3004 TaxID=1506994 RepID=UPI0004943C8C|nr:mechanosensitive ion channel family protein [Butyrivibrio sp. AE3004]